MKFILTFFILACALFVQGQDLTVAQVPAVISKSLTTTYPTATEIKWEKKKNSYKAAFKIGKSDHDLWLDNEGKTVKHRYEIKKDELPVPIQETINKDFSSYKIDDCEKTEEKQGATYKVELKSEAGKKNVHFGSDGKVIPKKSED